MGFTASSGEEEITMTRRTRPIRVAGGALPVGPIRLGWVAWFQVGVAGCLLLLALSERFRVWALVLAAVVLLLAVPIRGRSGLGWAGAALSYPTRRRRGVLTAAEENAPGDPTVELLASLMPRLTLSEGFTHDQEPIGMAQLDGRWITVLAVRAEQQILTQLGQSDTLPVEVLVPLLSKAGIRLDSIQVLAHNSPGSGAMAQGSPALQAHQELLRGLPTAARRRILIAIRLDPAACPSAIDARGGGAVGAHRALAATAGRVIAALAERGFQMQALDAAQLGRTIAAVVTLRRPEDPGGPFWHDRWGHVRIGDSLHRSFVVTGWGATRGNVNPLDQLGNIRATAVTTSVTLSGSPDHPMLTGSVRVTTRNDLNDLKVAELQLRQAADQARVSLAPADGFQHAALVAGMPLGGPVNVR